jgi:hypothetical protein
LVRLDRRDYCRYFQRLLRAGLDSAARRPLLRSWRAERRRTRAARERELRLGEIWDGYWSPQSSWPRLEESLVREFGRRGIEAELFAEASELPGNGRTMAQLVEQIRAEQDGRRRDRAQVRVMAMAA